MKRIEQQDSIKWRPSFCAFSCLKVSLLRRYCVYIGTVEEPLQHGVEAERSFRLNISAQEYIIIETSFRLNISAQQ